MLITNTSIHPTQQNFNGNLHIEGLTNFYPEKLEKIQQIFVEKTIGLPDATLRAGTRSINGGKPYHYTTFEFNNREFASLMTVNFRKIFKSRTAEQIADMLARFARAANKEDKTKTLIQEIEMLKTTRAQNLECVELHRSKKGRERLADSYEKRAKRLARKIYKLEEKYTNRRPVKKPLVGAKNWIYA